MIKSITMYKDFGNGQKKFSHCQGDRNKKALKLDLIFAKQPFSQLNDVNWQYHILNVMYPMLNTLCQPIHCSAVGPTTKLVTWPIWQWILASQALPIFPVCSLWQWQWCQVLKLLPFTQCQVQHPIIGDVRYDHWPGLQLKALPTFPSVNSVAVAMMPSAWLMIHVPTLGHSTLRGWYLDILSSFPSVHPVSVAVMPSVGANLASPPLAQFGWLPSHRPTSLTPGPEYEKRKTKIFFLLLGFNECWKIEIWVLAMHDKSSLIAAQKYKEKTIRILIRKAF